MGLVVLSAVSGPLKPSILKPVVRESLSASITSISEPVVLRGKGAPTGICRLLFDEFSKVEILVEDVGFCSRVADKALLIQLFGVLV